MGLTIERMDHPRGLRLSGELDLASAPALREALRLVMSTPGPLTFDLSELEFIDSTALLVLWEAAAEVAPHGGLTVVDPKPRVRTVLAITGFERAPGVNIVSRGRAVPPPG